MATEPTVQPSEGRLLDVKAVAARYGVTPRSVYRWRRAGLLGAVRVGGLLRFRRADLQAFERADRPVRRRRNAAIHGGGGRARRAPSPRGKSGPAVPASEKEA